MNIEFTNEPGEALGDYIGEGFDEYAKEHGVTCGYTEFAFVAKEGDEIAGVLNGNTLYNEVHIGELIVSPRHRGKGLGTALLNASYDHFKGKGYDHLALTTHGFQAPDFYKKCGFTAEYVRENTEDPKLTKYFMIRSLK